MPQSFRIPVAAKGQTPLRFPERCVGCGAPRQAESALVINRLVAQGQRQRQVSVKYQVPHCERCARATKTVFLAGCVPFVLGFLLVGGVAFAAVAYGAAALGFDDAGRPNNANSLVLGAAAGMAAGLAGAFVFELLARLLLLPILGRSLARAPLLAAQLLSNSDYVAGLTGRLERDGAHLELTFAREEAAREFEALNAALLGRNP